MKQMHFKTNARHIGQLGRELVTDYVTALVELVKNSYDADAYGVKLIFENVNTPDSRLVIVDSGEGMSQDDFEKKWMLIGTSNKLSEPYTKKGRKKSGKKGIGRFSVERLAEKIQIFSFPEDDSPYSVSINWNNFEDIDIALIYKRIRILRENNDVSSAKFLYTQLEYFLLNSQIPESEKIKVKTLFDAKFNNYEGFLLSENLEEFEKSIVPILEKYQDYSNEIQDISINLKENIDKDKNFEEIQRLLKEENLKTKKEKISGMVFVMAGLRDQWRQKDFNKLQKELQLLVAPDFLDRDPFNIELSANEFDIEKSVLSNEILELHYAKITASISDDGKKKVINYSDISGETSNLVEVLSEPLICGDVSLEMYYFLRSAPMLKNESYNYHFALNVLNTFCGVKIYRDGFRVKPYGDIGNDWLLLDQNKVKDTHGYLVGNNQVIGIVKIGEESNPLLIDATNRENIIENDAYEQLKSFVQECTTTISTKRYDAYKNERTEKEKEERENQEKVEKQFDEITSKVDLTDIVEELEKENKSKEKVVEEIEKKFIEKEKEIVAFKNNYDIFVGKKIDNYEETIKDKDSELAMYKNLASLGMLTGSFGHETGDIVNRIKLSLSLLKDDIRDKNPQNIPLSRVEKIGTDFSRIDSYSTLIIDYLKKNKRDINETLSVENTLKQIIDIYQVIIKSYGVEIEYKFEDIEVSMRQIDLESIIINMITNAFEHVKGKKEKRIIITCAEIDGSVKLIFEDTGNGVPDDKKNDLFKPFVSEKEEGIGLGLTIVRDLCERYSGNVYVEDSEEFGGAKFVVELFLGEDKDE